MQRLNNVHHQTLVGELHCQMHFLLYILLYQGLAELHSRTLQNLMQVSVFDHRLLTKIFQQSMWLIHTPPLLTRCTTLLALLPFLDHIHLSIHSISYINMPFAQNRTHWLNYQHERQARGADQ